ncbi:MAG: alanine racemase [Aquificota bacterium]|nr:alanine racemase [Aquificota bacterium]
MITKEGTCLGCRSVLRIDRSAVRHNVREIHRFSGKKIIAVVKSDAYGMGVRFVAWRPLLRELEEVEACGGSLHRGRGFSLRELGAKEEILILRRGLQRR